MFEVGGDAIVEICLCHISRRMAFVMRGIVDRERLSLPLSSDGLDAARSVSVSRRSRGRREPGCPATSRHWLEPCRPSRPGPENRPWLPAGRRVRPALRRYRLRPRVNHDQSFPSGRIDRHRHAPPGSRCCPLLPSKSWIRSGEEGDMQISPGLRRIRSRKTPMMSCRKPQENFVSRGRWARS